MNGVLPQSGEVEKFFDLIGSESDGEVEKFYEWGF
jgi:hypothetical protein